MDKKVITECKKYPIDSPSLLTFISVETGGYGFDQKTGKILIQFEPVWFKKLAPKTPNGIWATNKVSVQSKEWEAFNDAFKRNSTAAMESCSIGRMQVMGEHWRRLGFKSVGEMWDFAKKSEANQLWLGLKFIQTDTSLFLALLKKDWKEVARRYNGKNYWILGYDKKLERAEKKFSRI